VTPLQTGDAAVLVVRGWSPEPDADLLAASGEAEVTGWLQPPEGTLVVDDDPTDDVFPQLRTADLVQRLDGDVYSAYAVAQQGVGGLPVADLEELPDAGRFTALRNLLYALEWWVFGGFAVVLWWRYLQDAHRPGAAADDRVPSDA
jgi:cytochrome oxidase assembly protein ShyY1